MDREKVMSPARPVKLALIGGGMFGGDVVIRSIEDVERCGLAPYLGRVGFDHRAREMASLEFQLVAIGTRTATTAERLCNAYRSAIPNASPQPYHGETPWVDIFNDHKIDVVLVATCLLYTSPSPRDGLLSRMPSSA